MEVPVAHLKDLISLLPSQIHSQDIFKFVPGPKIVYLMDSFKKRPTKIVGWVSITQHLFVIEFVFYFYFYYLSGCSPKIEVFFDIVNSRVNAS